MQKDSQLAPIAEQILLWRFFFAIKDWNGKRELPFLKMRDDSLQI